MTIPFWITYFNLLGMGLFSLSFTQLLAASKQIQRLTKYSFEECLFVIDFIAIPLFPWIARRSNTMKDLNGLFFNFDSLGNID